MAQATGVGSGQGPGTAIDGTQGKGGIDGVLYVAAGTPSKRRRPWQLGGWGVANCVWTDCAVSLLYTQMFLSCCIRTPHPLCALAVPPVSTPYPSCVQQCPSCVSTLYFCARTRAQCPPCIYTEYLLSVCAHHPAKALLQFCQCPTRTPPEHGVHESPQLQWVQCCYRKGFLQTQKKGAKEMFSGTPKWATEDGQRQGCWASVCSVAEGIRTHGPVSAPPVAAPPLHLLQHDRSHIAQCVHSRMV